MSHGTSTKPAPGLRRESQLWPIGFQLEVTGDMPLLLFFQTEQMATEITAFAMDNGTPGSVDH